MTTDASTLSNGQPVDADRLRVGEWVRVKSRDEILATLDGDGRVDGMPFMPEMLAFAGRTVQVSAVTHRTCDTVKAGGTSGTTRKMAGSVHLGDLRCDGAAHDGCQARCLLFWKQDWLEQAAPGDVPPASGATAAPDEQEVPAFLQAATRAEGDSADSPRYACQATELLRASQFVSARDPKMWLKDVRSGNARITTAIASIAVLMFNKWQSKSTRLPSWLRIHQGRAWPWYAPTGEKRRYPPLDLRPGELVEVKPLPEIEATLDDKGALRGLRFAAEMIPFCGKQARVLDRVDRIVDEKSGRMLKLRDCIVLEDVWCRGTFRALCRRKIYTYWREAWLRRVGPPAS